MSKPRQYLAGPFTHKNPKIQKARGRQHCEWAVKLLREGHLIYSPIAETMNLAKYGHMEGTDWNTWREKDLKEISLSDEMWLLMLPGWKDSIGVRGEVKYCLKNNIPISVLDIDTCCLFEVHEQFFLEQFGVQEIEELNN